MLRTRLAARFAPERVDELIECGARVLPFLPRFFERTLQSLELLEGGLLVERDMRFVFGGHQE